MEPSALAGMAGPAMLQNSEAGKKYLKKHNLTEQIENGTHIIWGTGGSLVPEDVMRGYYMRGREITDDLKNAVKWK
jgi:D-serine dehydratase